MKTGVELDCEGIAKKDADQLRGSVQWNADHHPGVANIPVMVHPVDLLDEKAIRIPGMRVITPAKLAELTTAVKAFATALTQGQNLWTDEHAVAQQLTPHHLGSDRIITTYSVPARAPR